VKRKLTKKIIIFLTALAFTAKFNSAFALDAPVLTTSTSGLDVSLSWTPVLGATNYTLYYAPHPYAGEDTIGAVSMEASTNFSVTLWSGAAYYIAVTASNGDVFSESGYSNVGFFTLTESPLANPEDYVGKWTGLYDSSIITLELRVESGYVVGSYSDDNQAVDISSIYNPSNGTIDFDIPSYQTNNPDCNTWNVSVNADVNQSLAQLTLSYTGTACNDFSVSGIIVVLTKIQ